MSTPALSYFPEDTTANLPTLRVLVNTLLSTLPASLPVEAHTSSNPLKQAPPSVRSFLSTLHIIFPSLLLPALDLLDRRLVTRVIEQKPMLSRTAQRAGPEQRRDQPPIPILDHGDPVEEVTKRTSTEGVEAAVPSITRDGGDQAPTKDYHPHRIQNTLYLIRSSQSSRSRNYPDKSYSVRLHAWNCTCAAFAFSAFPGPASSEGTIDAWQDLPSIWDFACNSHGSSEGDPGKGESEGDGVEDPFGGVSGDGVDGGAVPCCKHILACLLADRWENWLGNFVTQREAGREEMAGLAAET